MAARHLRPCVFRDFGPGIAVWHWSVRFAVERVDEFGEVGVHDGDVVGPAGNVRVGESFEWVQHVGGSAEPPRHRAASLTPKLIVAAMRRNASAASVRPRTWAGSLGGPSRAIGLKNTVWG